jgi:flagellar motor switch protein FliM
MASSEQNAVADPLGADPGQADARSGLDPLLSGAAGRSGKAAVRTADLLSVPDLSSRAFPGLGQIDDRIARRFTKELNHFLRIDTSVHVTGSSVLKQHQLAASYDTVPCLNHLYLEELGGHALLIIDQPLILRMLERTFGFEEVPKAPDAVDTGEPRPSANDVQRARYSVIEEQVIRRVVHLFGRAMETSWRPVLPLTVRHLRIETNPENVPLGGPTDAILCSAFKVNLGSSEGTVRCAIPMGLLELYKPRLAASGGAAPQASSAEQWRHQLTESVRAVEVDVVAELGRVRSTLRKLLALKVGDVLRLDQAPGQPVVVSIGGVAKYRAQPTVRDGNLAVELRTLFDPERYTASGATLIGTEDPEHD